MTRHPAYRHPAWFDRPAHRLLRAAGAGITVLRPAPNRRGGFAVRVTLTPAGLDPQPVTIEFSANSPDIPHI